MTDISVASGSFNPEDLTWDLTPDLDARWKSNGTLDVSKFDATKHYPEGFIKSGTVLQKGTSGLLEPYSSGGTVAGILAASVPVLNTYSAQVKKHIGVAVLEAFAVVKESRLPIAKGTAGALDDAAKTALPRIHFVA